MPEQVTLSAPSRLHFGLFSVGDTAEREFGGAGLMVTDPRTIVTATRSDAFEITGLNLDAARHTMQMWFDNLCPPLKQMLGVDRLAELGVGLRIESTPPRHAGFGSGTQLAFSLAMAVTQLFELPSLSPPEMASLVGRGKRSAIGSHGFFRGGFLVDRGITRDDSLAPLDFHAGFSESWPVVTVLLRDAPGLSGQMEKSAFETLSPTPAAIRSELIDMVRGKVIPGIVARDYDPFAEGVYELGRRSGMMFSNIQGGPYNGPHVEMLVSRIRDFGVPAVGQSSWGPCVFAIARNDGTAQQLVSFLQTEYGDRCQIGVTKADNQGARILSSKPQTVFESQ